jgi:hypothetical protein
MLKINLIKYLLAFLVFSFLSGLSWGPLGPEHGVDVEVMNKIRNDFYLAVDSEVVTIKLAEFIKQKFADNFDRYPPVIQAYYAALEGLRGKHAKFPLDKYSYVNKGIIKINRAVNRQPDGLEARFLRFAFFHQVPDLFGVRKYVASDLKTVIQLIKERDCKFVCSSVQKDMIIYMLGTKELGKEQRVELKQIYDRFVIDEYVSAD